MSASIQNLSAHDFETFLSSYRDEFNRALKSSVEPYYSGVADAIRYSLLLPSKRLRPIFCLESCRAFCGSPDLAIPAAISLEMVHTYSLIHDDLPSMDNDDLRRGRPTNHKVYGEARAILAGDGLQSLAFQILSEAKEIKPEIRMQLISELSRASGIEGMVLGQDLDIEKRVESLSDLEELHRKKTGALLSSSVVMGALVGGASVENLEVLRAFALDMGLAFQIRDDILDVEGGEELGKPAKSDEKNNKKTYVSFLGLEGAKQNQLMWTAKALEKLSSIRFPYPNQLEQLTRFVVERRS